MKRLHETKHPWVFLPRLLIKIHSTHLITLKEMWASVRKGCHTVTRIYSHHNAHTQFIFVVSNLCKLPLKWVHPYYGKTTPSWTGARSLVTAAKCRASLALALFFLHFSDSFFLSSLLFRITQWCQMSNYTCSAAFCNLFLFHLQFVYCFYCE